MIVLIVLPPGLKISLEYKIKIFFFQDEMRDTVDCSGVNSLESNASATSLSSTGSYPAINPKLAETLDSLNISTKTGDRSFDSSQEI